MSEIDRGSQHPGTCGRQQFTMLAPVVFDLTEEQKKYPVGKLNPKQIFTLLPPIDDPHVQNPIASPWDTFAVDSSNSCPESKG